MSLSLGYDNGQLVRGITRGDGTVGEDVMLNGGTVRLVPLRIPREKLQKAGIPPDFEVRGELLMPLAAFKKMNEERESKGLSLFANPRNATAGTVRQLESRVTAERRLDFFSYVLLQMAAHISSGTPRPWMRSRAPVSKSTRTASWFTAWRRSGRSSSSGRQSGTRCRMRSTASWSKWIASRYRTSLASPAKRRAGPLRTSMRRGRGLRSWKTFAYRWGAPGNL